MTNTNDFRGYTGYGSSNYLIDSFDVTRGSHAPKLRPQEEPSQPLKLRQNKKLKSKSVLRKEERISVAKAIKVAAVAVLCLGMICMVLHSMALKNELTKEISAKQTAIANAQSDYISLQSQLNSAVSMKTIDKVAVEKLGMTKMNSNQIQYMDVDEFVAAQKKAAEKEKAEAEKKAHQKTDQKSAKSNK
ncbi:MAG: hypothetical protein IJR60_00385 [Eubacterium sp.]|nr:hypothetical protein [Eubacterium sp.]